MLKTFLKDHYNLEVSEITPLAIGADPNAAVYQVDSAYFLKLHRGNFNHITLQVPHFLQKQGVKRVVAPIPTQSGELYTQYENAIAILYPFIEGKDGFTVNLSAQNWVDLGETLRQIHKLTIPNLRQEIYTPTGETLFNHIKQNQTIIRLLISYAQSRWRLIILSNRQSDLRHT